LETEDPRDQSDERLEDDVVIPPAIDVDITRRDRTRTKKNTNSLNFSHQFGDKNNLYSSIGYNALREADRPATVESAEYDEMTGALGLETWFGQNWGIAIDTEYSDRDFEERDDRKEYFGAIKVLRSFGRRLSGFVEYNYTVLDFNIETEDEDYQIHAPSLGIQYQISERQNLSLGASYYVQTFDQSDDETGFFIDAQLNNRWTYRKGYIGTVVASGYDIEDKGARDLGFKIYYQGDIEAGYNFTTKLTGRIYLSYRYDDYRNEVPDRDDQTFKAGAGFEYQALRWMFIGLSYRLDTVTSTLDSEEFTENSALLTISLSPSSPFRLN
jgi:hypothetical protein